MSGDHSVMIVGGGPVGLTLAIDLGQRGIDCILVEKRPRPALLPKMERVHARTMEHFRRLGLAETIRRAGYPRELPLSSYLVTSLVEHPLMCDYRPSVAEMQALSRDRNDGTQPAEPYQIISQYTLEPLLKAEAEETPGVTVRFATELTGFTELDDSVAVMLRSADGSTEQLKVAYLVGCDGASSSVRKGLGAVLEGEANLGELTQALIYCEELFERIAIGAGAHYHIADDRWTFMIVQDDRKHFSMHTRAETEEEIREIFESAIGMKLAYQILYRGKWTMRLMLANRYASNRVFIAGDAAHLVTPIGGFGMNTGIGDAVDLAWKLDGVINGWGGSRLLASYEQERRLIGKRNLEAATRAYWARRRWREAYENHVRGDGATDAPTSTETLGRIALTETKRGRVADGVILGYRYLASEIICHEAGDDGGDQDEFAKYTTSTRPGIRLPHVWLEDGLAIQDKLSRYTYTLVCLDCPEREVYAALKEAFVARGCPFERCDLSWSQAARSVYGDGYLLVRPDMHIAWRGSELTPDSASLVSRVTGCWHPQMQSAHTSLAEAPSGLVATDRRHFAIDEGDR